MEWARGGVGKGNTEGEGGGGEKVCVGLAEPKMGL